MVYETDFYTVRRPYSRPTISSYSVTSPRHYVVLDTPDRSRRADEQYSYSYSSSSERVRGAGAPGRNYSSRETVSRSTAGGPEAYSSTTERSSRSSGYPGSYHSSYSSVTSGRLPHGTTYRHYSYRAPRISVTTWKVKPSIRTSVLIGELDRIYHRSRPHLSYVPTEDFLNSRPLVDFDDETKIIRAETERLMKRIYTSVPHPRTTIPLQILPYYGHYTDKYSSPRHRNTVPEDILNMSYYNEPSARTIGRGHLACVSFAGGRGYPRRKHLYSDENRDIHEEIKFRSYYNKNRAFEEAMSLPTGFASYLLRLQPDNRNGNLTSSEKLHITNILKERKEKNNSTDKHQKMSSETINGNLEKKLSSYKSKSVDETTIPIEREAKLNRSKSKDSNLVEKSKKEINVSIDYPLITNTLINTISEEPQTHQNVPEKLEQAPDVSPLEREVEINIESKAPQEKMEQSSKPASKAAKPKTPTKEKELKIAIEPEIKVKEERKEMAETKIDVSEEKKEEPLNTVLPQLLDTAKEVKQETIVDQNADKEIQSSITEQSTEECKEEFITKEDVPTTIEEDLSLSVKENKGENIEDSVVNDNKTETAEETEKIIIDEGNDEAVSYKTENNFEKEDEKIEKNVSSNVSESFSETIQQEVTETHHITSIESSKVIFSSETQETIVKNNETEDNNAQHESINEQVIPETEEDSSKSGVNLSSEETNAEVQEKISTTTEEVSENWKSNNTIKEEDHVIKLNEESLTEQNETLKERIINIEIERTDEPTEAQNMIEEVTDLGSPDTHRESETVPLIEEPQSPEADLIYNKSTTNEVCELLSDVPEEF